MVTLQSWYSALFHLWMFQIFVSKSKIILVVIFVCWIQVNIKIFKIWELSARWGYNIMLTSPV